MRNISILWVLDFKMCNFFLSSSLSSYILSQAVRSQVALHDSVWKSSISLSSSGKLPSSMFVRVKVLSHFPSLPSRYPRPPSFTETFLFPLSPHWQPLQDLFSFNSQVSKRIILAVVLPAWTEMVQNKRILWIHNLLQSGRRLRRQSRLSYGKGRMTQRTKPKSHGNNFQKALDLIKELATYAHLDFRISTYQWLRVPPVFLPFQQMYL